MTDEKVFLNESDVFVSSSRIVISGTTYSTANITSIRKSTTPAKRDWALRMILLGALGVLLSWYVYSEDPSVGVGLGGLLLSLALVIGGVLWLLKLRSMHHFILSAASGETEVLSSQDESLIDKAVQSIGEAIVHQG